MEDNKKEKGRGLGKGLSELLGEARAKAAMAKQTKNEIDQTQQINQSQVNNSLSDELEKIEEYSKELSSRESQSKQNEEIKTERNTPQQATVSPSVSSQKDSVMNMDDDDFELVTQVTETKKTPSLDRGVKSNKNEEGKKILDKSENASFAKSNKSEEGEKILDKAENASFAKSNKSEEDEKILDKAENTSFAKSNKNEGDAKILDKVENAPFAKSNKSEEDAKILDKAENASFAKSNKSEEDEKILDKSENAPFAKSNKSEESAKILDKSENAPFAKSNKSEESAKILDKGEMGNGGANRVHSIPVELLVPNQEQPRKYFDNDALMQLANSIKIYGIIQPILVNQMGNEYQIVAGERRWRAAQLIGLKDVPVVIVNYNHHETLEVALIENIQRADLEPLDEAQAYYDLIHKYELTQNELAMKIGRSRSHVANMIRLLDLDPTVKKYVQDGELTIGHARALIGIPNAKTIADKVVKSGLNVRQTEELVYQPVQKENARLPTAHKFGKDSDILALEADLKAALGVPVSINMQTAQKGNLVIRYESLEQLDEICKRLCSNWGNNAS